MEKLINFYKKLSPPARFRLIFFILASLIVVPLRKDSGVEVYEPYRYDIEDVEENQVVFAHRYTNFSWGKEDYIWIIRKDGTCKRKDLVGNHDIDYQCEELTDEELLDKMDEYMQDETLPEMDKKLALDKEKINHCINILHTELSLTMPSRTRFLTSYFVNAFVSFNRRRHRYDSFNCLRIHKITGLKSPTVCGVFWRKTRLEDEVLLTQDEDEKRSFSPKYAIHGGSNLALSG